MQHSNHRAEIIVRLNGLARRAYSSEGDWDQKDREGCTRWTTEIKTELAKLGKSHGFEVCCSGQARSSGFAEWGEWLYDLCWLDPHPTNEVNGFYLSMPLAVESEWARSMDQVLPDFQKLLFSAAELRL